MAPLIAASSDCRATDVLDILVQSRRNTKAAKRFMRKLVKQYGEPRVLITDKLDSYGSAKRNLIPGVEHRQHKGLNNKAEVSHRQTRRREKIFRRFKSPRQAQMFLAAHDQISCLFRPRRHILSAISYRHAKSDAHSLWSEYSAELIA
jgi:putative transposase